MPDQGSIDRFYKKSVLGKDTNLFLRVEVLEEFIRLLKSGANGTSVTQNISNIIYENREIILSSVAGGTTDPTDAAFTGVVISPSGQYINGVLYHFALVIDGVVFNGLGDDGGTPVSEIGLSQAQVLARIS